MATRKQRKLTPFGRWVKMKTLEQDMSLQELASSIGTGPTRLSEIMHGVIPGHKYRSEIEKVLGAKPPANIAS